METHSDVGYIIWRGNNDVFGRVFQEAVGSGGKFDIFEGADFGEGS